MIDRRVPGYPASEAIFVTSSEVAAAKALVRLARQQDEEVDYATQAIADALPEVALYLESDKTSAKSARPAGRPQAYEHSTFDRRVPGRPVSEAILVTSTEVYAAKALVSLAKKWDEEVDYAIQAIADALPKSSLNQDSDKASAIADTHVT